jgi:hypothetical protein
MPSAALLCGRNVLRMAELVLGTRDAPGINRTCARGLGTCVRKRHLQPNRTLSPCCAPVHAPGYPAVGAFPLVLYDLDAYMNSVYSGIDELAYRLQDEEDRCPDERIVLVGYSQGAQVIHLAVGWLAGSPHLSQQNRSHRLRGRSCKSRAIAERRVVATLRMVRKGSTPRSRETCLRSIPTFRPI